MVLFLDFYLHHHLVLALRLRVSQSFAYLGRARHFRTVDLEDDVSRLQALLGGRAVRINCRNSHGLEHPDHHDLRARA